MYLINKFLAKLRRSISPPFPTLCEDLAVWASRRENWSIKLIHDAFTIKSEPPANSLSNEVVKRRFLNNTNLGFSSQFLITLPEAIISGEIGFVILEEGAYVIEGNWRTSNVIFHPSVLIPTRNKRKKLEGNYYSIRSYYSSSYHHWFWDDLPRLFTALPYLPDDTIFIVGYHFLEFQKQSLKTLGILGNRIDVQPANSDYLCEKLYFATPLGHSEYAATAPDVARQLQSIFNPSIPSSPSRKIYISRSLAKHRRLINEAELLPILDKFGFEVIHAEELSSDAQVKIFNDAKVILSPHGAGLTNMLFSPQGATILELFEPTAARTHYWMMSHALGHNYDCLIGETTLTDNLKLDPDFRIPKDRFSTFIYKHLREIYNVKI